MVTDASSGSGPGTGAGEEVPQGGARFWTNGSKVSPGPFKVPLVLRLEGELARLGLGEAEIQAKDLVGLESCLRELDELIQRPTDILLAIADVFSDVTDASRQALVSSKLFDRRVEILNRMSELREELRLAEFNEALSSAAERPADVQNVMLNFNDKYTLIQQEERSTQAEIAATEAAKAKAQHAAMRLEVELSERRSAIRRKWIERESIASIVGALLLLALATALIVAMFIGKAATEVVTSAFLLILGYFFGTSTARRAEDSDKPKE
jgi:hypothetical protein